MHFSPIPQEDPRPDRASVQEIRALLAQAGFEFAREWHGGRMHEYMGKVRGVEFRAKLWLWNQPYVYLRSTNGEYQGNASTVARLSKLLALPGAFTREVA